MNAKNVLKYVDKIASELKFFAYIKNRLGRDSL